MISPAKKPECAARRAWTCVYLKLGPLSGVVKEALLFSYEIACQQTPLEGSKLLIEEVPIVVNCPVCMDRRSVQSIQSLCCAIAAHPPLKSWKGAS